MTLPRAAAAIKKFHIGELSAPVMLDAIRVDLLYTPVSGQGDVLAAQAQGLTWLPAFTSREVLATYARQRGEGGQTWQYATVRGARLLDAILAKLPQPAALAIDLGSRHPMLVPADDMS